MGATILSGIVGYGPAEADRDVFSEGPGTSGEIEELFGSACP